MKIHGIDLHTDSFFVETMELIDGKFVSKRSKHNFEDSSYQIFLDSLTKEDYAIVESTLNAFWFHDQIVDRVKECYVYNTNKAGSEGNKTDKIDAKKLAEKLAYYIIMGKKKEDLPVVYVPDEKVRELRGLFSSYQLYKKIKTQLKNRIHSILKQNGICVNRKALDNKDFKEKLEKLSLSEVWKFQIISILRELKNTELEQNEIKKMIYLLGNELFNSEIKLLMSIKGFSPLTAIALMSDIVDIKRFTNAKRFCSYLRAAPKVKSSNKTTHIKSVNRQSRATTCSLLTQSMLYLIQTSEHMNEFYNRVKIGKSAGKWRIAVIRKILVSAYHMLKRNTAYYSIDEECYNRKITKFKRDIKKIGNEIKLGKVA